MINTTTSAKQQNGARLSGKNREVQNNIKLYLKVNLKRSQQKE